MPPESSPEPEPPSSPLPDEPLLPLPPPPPLLPLPLLPLLLPLLDDDPELAAELIEPIEPEVPLSDPDDADESLPLFPLPLRPPCELPGADEASLPPPPPHALNPMIGTSSHLEARYPIVITFLRSPKNTGRGRSHRARRMALEAGTRAYCGIRTIR